ncbi:1,4-dihydroxy-2-naphthoate polyprenyltransferase [Agilicoccus flavus]|uniref:1,4-dihydroxy-2-naphthoate polyprenyltransferase n=1 Tax=Agilicoccus flavus TaxID=2775968 RepID=UPI001CF62FD2|nr:1,4-dihydroxy-2-naphthoate polyprenyltransferase [Agilicoccus flavus]
MATLSQWIGGARPRTLPTAFAPVFIGTAAAYAAGSADLLAAFLALGVALALQVAVNYANDYSDGVRGTDDVGRRVGPVRLVGQRLAAPGQVKRAASAAFGVAAVLGLGLTWRSGAWYMLAVGAACILAAWYYTGGDHPYGYLGLGEVFVFVFFGLVATLGTILTQAHTTTLTAWAGAVGVGALSCAVLVANNLRDIPGDTLAGKRTLAVRLGDGRTRTLYVVLVALAFGCALLAAADSPGAVAALAAGALALAPLRRVRSGATGADLVPVLAGTGMLVLGYGILFSLGVALLP